MKKGKFIFESFQEFLDYAETLNEKLNLTSIKELQTYLSSNGMNKDGQTALSSSEELSEKAGPKREFTANNIIPLNNALSKLNKANVTEILEITVDESEVNYSNMISGSVVTNTRLKLNKTAGRVGLADLLTAVNEQNLKSKSYVIMDQDKKNFLAGDKTKHIKDTGVVDNYCLVANKGALDFVKYKAEKPINNWAAEPAAEILLEPIEGKKSDTWRGSFILYYPTDISPNTGASYTATDIVQIERPVARTSETLSPIVIENDDVLFDVDKSVLKEAGKAVILSALSNVAAAKTIKITGGASIEGTRERNETLCKERAQAVADFLKAGAFKNAEITVSDKADIQESGEIDPTRRRVILDITGEQLVSTTQKGTETVFKAKDASGKADVVTIKQVAIEIQSTFV
jgi:outer membrane protein OmpA-like peptidoglycan-associated protein